MEKWLRKYLLRFQVISNIIIEKQNYEDLNKLVINLIINYYYSLKKNRYSSKLTENFMNRDN